MKHLVCGLDEFFIDWGLGTSMAAPVVSGNALLIRDYFKNAWPSICTAGFDYCKSFTPTGYLLKAVILHSGRAVTRCLVSCFDLM